MKECTVRIITDAFPFWHEEWGGTILSISEDCRWMTVQCHDDAGTVLKDVQHQDPSVEGEHGFGKGDTVTGVWYHQPDEAGKPYIPAALNPGREVLEWLSKKLEAFHFEFSDPVSHGDGCTACVKSESESIFLSVSFQRPVSEDVAEWLVSVYKPQGCRLLARFGHLGYDPEKVRLWETLRELQSEDEVDGLPGKRFEIHAARETHD